jgi:hypothetical protein
MVPENKQNRRYDQINFIDLQNNRHPSQPFFIMKRLGKGCFGRFGRIMGISIISYRKNSLDLRPT